jgi:hypothetical protein
MLNLLKLNQPDGSCIQALRCNEHIFQAKKPAPFQRQQQSDKKKKRTHFLRGTEKTKEKLVSELQAILKNGRKAIAMDYSYTRYGFISTNDRLSSSDS